METLHHDREPPMNKRERRRKEIDDTRSLLARKFPEAFKGKGLQKVPLAVGIRLAIHERVPGLSHRLLHAVLGDYTGGPTYLRNLVEGAKRVDLDGNPVEFVTESQAAHAVATMKSLEASWREQRERSIAKRRAHHPELRA